MQKKNHFQTDITRRSFLKTTGIVGGTLAVSGLGGAAFQGFAQDYGFGQAAASEEQIFRGVCRPNCFAFCHLNVHVKDGLIIKTSRAPYNEKEYNRICLRGLSHVQRVYDPVRLKYPLRQKGERGSDNWERITWDEAISEIAEKIKSFQAQYGDQAVSFLTTSGNQGLLITSMYNRLRNVINASQIAPAVDMASSYGLSRMTGPLTNLWESNEHPDRINAKSIVVWGGNITDAQVQTWHFFNEAKRNGSKLIVIDPTFTQLAAKADRWIPIRPGTDAALNLALMNVVIEKNAINVEFLQKHTVAPFLVKSDTGKFLRRSDLGIPPTATGKVDPLTQKEIIYDPAMVIQDGAAVAAEEAKSPDLEASYNFNGVSCSTAYALLKKEVEHYTPKKVSEITQIPEDTIYELAEISIDQPVTHYVGYGPQAYMNGTHTTHSGMTLNALLGNLGYPGASYGSFWHIFFYANAKFAAPTGVATSPNISIMAYPHVMRTGKYQDKETPIKMLYIYNGNPLCCSPDTNMFLNDVYGNLDFVVVADSVMTDTARFADLVLPIAQWFEVTEVTNAGETVAMNYNEKAIEPLYESKPDAEIVRLIAEKLGRGDLFKMTDDEALDEILSGPMCDALGISLSALKEKKEVRFVKDYPHIAFRDNVFTTPSGRLEFYIENPIPRALSEKQITPELIAREHLPRFFPPSEAWHESDAMKKYPFHCMSERPRFRVHSQWFSVPLLRELDPEPTVKINQVDAEEYGITQGDYVECFNDRGHVVAKAVVSNAVRPKTLVYPKGWQMNQHKAGSWSEISSCDYDEFAVNGNFMDVVCAIRLWNEGGMQ